MVIYLSLLPLKRCCETTIPFVFLPGTSFLRQGQAPLPFSPLQPLVTPWQRAQCTHPLPGHCQGILCLGPPSSSRNPPSTAPGGKNCNMYTWIWGNPVLSVSVSVDGDLSVDCIFCPVGVYCVREKGFQAQMVEFRKLSSNAQDGWSASSVVPNSMHP